MNYVCPTPLRSSPGACSSLRVRAFDAMPLQCVHHWQVLASTVMPEDFYSSVCIRQCASSSKRLTLGSPTTYTFELRTTDTSGSPDDAILCFSSVTRQARHAQRDLDTYYHPRQRPARRSAEAASISPAARTSGPTCSVLRNGRQLPRAHWLHAPRDGVRKNVGRSGRLGVARERRSAESVPPY